TAPSAQEIVRNSAALDAVAAYFARLNPGSGRTDQKRLGRLRQVLDHARSLRDDLEAARRAAALRENLRKRKSQSRARDGGNG
ncbi:MAG: hypothetical protein ACPHIA_07670, partial [Alphaproteobacteria bacterium]